MKKKVLSVSGVILLLVIVAAAVLYLFPESDIAKNQSEITVDITVISGNNNEEHSIVTDCKYLGDALLEEGIVKGENGEYGLFITEVSGIEADVSKEQWWCITKEGEEIMAGASQIEIHDNDRYELTLKEGY